MTVYSLPRYRPSVRALAGDSTMTNVCATSPPDVHDISAVKHPSPLSDRPITQSQKLAPGASLGGNLGSELAMVVEVGEWVEVVVAGFAGGIRAGVCGGVGAEGLRRCRRRRTGGVGA